MTSTSRSSLPPVEYRPFRADDTEALRQLYEKVFGSEMRAEHWRWRFVDNPAGESYIRVAEVAGRLVGQFAFAALPLRHRGRSLRGYVALDGMIHPDHHRRGIFGNLERQVTATMPREVPFYGFPNHKSHPLFIHKLGWAAAGQPRVFVKLLSSAGLARRSPVFHLARPALAAYRRLYRDRGRRLEIEPMPSFAGADGELGSLLQTKGMTFDRSPEFLRWRYDDAPHSYQRYRLSAGGQAIGYLVTRRQQRFGLEIVWVIDLVTAGDPEGHSTSGALASLERNLGDSGEAPDLLALMLAEPRQERSVGRVGFREVPRRWLPHDFFFIVKRNDYPHAEVDHMNSWHMGWGLHDAL